MRFSYISEGLTLFQLCVLQKSPRRDAAHPDSQFLCLCFATLNACCPHLRVCYPPTFFASLCFFNICVSVCFVCIAQNICTHLCERWKR